MESLSKIFLSIIVTTFLFISCTSKPVELDDPELMSTSKSYAKVYAGTLKKKVKTAIVQEGVETAIDFCNLNAIPLSDSISRAKNVVFKRVSHKNRNPKNKANAFELSLIETYAQNNSKAPKLFKDGKNELFYAPIYIDSPLCLNCHGKVGKEISEVVYQKISSLYPNDLATDFTSNELRGLLKIIYTP